MKSVDAALEEATARLSDTATRVAGVGASNAPWKYGNIIVKNLLRHGYRGYPVNLHEATIAGLTGLRSLSDVPKPAGGGGSGGEKRDRGGCPPAPAPAGSRQRQ